MIDISDQISLRNLRTDRFSDRANKSCKHKPESLFICTSGYEKRSVYFARKILKLGISAGQFLVIGFDDFTDYLNRIENDKFFSKLGVKVKPFKQNKKELVIGYIIKAIKERVASAGDEPIEIHIDYSCMPRLWYCYLPSIVEKVLRKQDRVYFWYTPGHYINDFEYPTAGVEDFKLFSGKPTVCPDIRTHIFGLGFDKIRTQAIWSVLDPSNLICYYAILPIVAKYYEDYLERVKKDNQEILMLANGKFSVPMDDFVFSLSKIVSMVRQYRNLGDVILVPDGPKPLILATSLASLMFNVSGIVCFHVRRQRSYTYQPVDVEGIEEPIGFSFSGISNVDESSYESN